MLVRPTPWGRGKSSWGPWNGLDRGIVVSFRLGKWIFDDLRTVTDCGCVEGT